MMRAGRDESGDMGVESYARYIEEETIANPACIDTSDFRAPCRSIARAGSNGMSSSRASPLPTSRNDPQCRTALRRRRVARPRVRLR